MTTQTWPGPSQGRAGPSFVLDISRPLDAGGLDVLLAPQEGTRYIQIMRRFRFFLFLLLSIAVPLQGYAHFALPKAPCPMEQMAMMDTADAAAHDCCNDAETAAKTGKPCKSGQPCQSVGQLMPVSGLELLPRDLAASVRFPRLADITFTFDPAATWRPPAQL